jgi:hypothetical protein
MEAKLRNSYPDSDFTTQIDYVKSRTSDTAWTLIDNHVNRHAVDRWSSTNDCWSEFDTNYLSRHEASRAKMQLNMLTLKDWNYKKFILGFKNLAAKANVKPDVQELWLKLPKTLQKDTMHLQHGTFSALHDWCVMNQDTNQALREMHGTGSKSDNSNSNGRKPNGNPGN